jgi:competence protein ComEA
MARLGYDKIDLNTATMDQLTRIDGIGTRLARKIIEYRQTNGNFAKLDDLGNIDGFSPQRLRIIRDLVTVSSRESF